MEVLSSLKLGCLFKSTCDFVARYSGMTRSLLIVSVLALGLSFPKAYASNCTVDLYDHNGSLMEVQICDNGEVAISYIQPRKGLLPHGVHKGTLLLDGVVQEDGVINGRARIFDRRCGAITYSVVGSNLGGSLLLQGSAPVRNKSCQISRHRPDTLVFTLQAAGPQVVPPSCPPGYNLSQGQCIRARPQR